MKISYISHVVVALVEGGHATWRASPTSTTTSLSTSTAALVRGLLHPRSVHQMESTLVLVMEVRVRRTSAELRCILVWKEVQD